MIKLEINRKTKISPEEAFKWRNYCFNKNGKSHRGQTLYPDKKSAQQRIYEIEQMIKNDICGDIGTLDGDIKAKDYHYSMQMPELI